MRRLDERSSLVHALHERWEDNTSLCTNSRRNPRLQGAEHARLQPTLAGLIPPSDPLDPVYGGYLNKTCVPLTVARLRAVQPPEPRVDGTPCRPPKTADGQSIVWSSANNACGVWSVDYSTCLRSSSNPGCGRAVDVPKCPTIVAAPASWLSYNSFFYAAGYIIKGDGQGALDQVASSSITNGGSYIGGKFVGSARFAGNGLTGFIGKV